MAVSASLTDTPPDRAVRRHALAAAHPVTGAHSIWGLVTHITWWLGALRDPPATGKAPLLDRLPSAAVA